MGFFSFQLFTLYMRVPLTIHMGFFVILNINIFFGP